ncbi:unnamed protein product [Paramecium pentaurelia]|uniref:Uncharacterized protein n=1 Tax=Paramecium pentaurelia TaxID=43138 RepID=A0A8S1T4X2_9CILI|nr:unnamed protein product [Paramecium pentaurelia]
MCNHQNKYFRSILFQKSSMTKQNYIIFFLFLSQTSKLKENDLIIDNFCKDLKKLNKKSHLIFFVLFIQQPYPYDDESLHFLVALHEQNTFMETKQNTQLLPILIRIIIES